MCGYLVALKLIGATPSGRVHSRGVGGFSGARAVG